MQHCCLILSTCLTSLHCSFSLVEVQLGSISEVIQPALRLGGADCDPELQKLLLSAKNVFMTRNWDSHEFSVTVSEYKHAIESLIELCILFKKRLEHAALDPEFDDCIANLHVCLNAIDHLQDGGISPAATTCSLRVSAVRTGTATTITIGFNPWIHSTRAPTSAGKQRVT